MTITQNDDAFLISQPILLYPTNVVAPNRILKAAMTELVCDWSEDPVEIGNRGKPNKKYLALHEQWGQGGIGVLVFGNIHCDVRYIESRGNPIIDKTASWDHVALFKPAIEAAKADGAVVLCQINHAGRQTESSIAEVPVSCSDLKSPPLGPKTFNTPRPLTIPEIEDVVDRFAFTSNVLYQAGAHGIQIHAAHGYLCSEFLSPDVNKRTDKYGGSLENRSRIIFEIIDAIKTRVGDPNFIISIKINSADFTDGGFCEQDCRELAIRLENEGVALIELSGGTYDSLGKMGGFTHLKPSTIKREAFFIEFAERLRPHLSRTALCLTGGFRTASGMATALRERSCDLVGLARPLSAEPGLAGELVRRVKDSAKENKVPRMLQVAASNIQIFQMAAGERIDELSNDEEAKLMVKKITESSNAIITGDHD